MRIRYVRKVYAAAQCATSRRGGGLIIYPIVSALFSKRTDK